MTNELLPLAYEYVWGVITPTDEVILVDSTTKSSKIQNGRQNDIICKKMADFHTLLACNMSFCRFFGSRNKILILLTSVSVHGWSYMAKLRNFDVKCNFVKKWFNLIHNWLITRLYRSVWVKRQTFETLVVNFCTLLDLMAKWHNSDVRLHSLARKWFHFHKLLACNTSL